MGAERPVEITDLLGVIREFEPYEPEGVGAGLIAWELKQVEGTILEEVERAVDAGLVEASGRDRRSGEELWRLTARGRELAGVA